MHVCQRHFCIPDVIARLLVEALDMIFTHNRSMEWRMKVVQSDARPLTAATTTDNHKFYSLFVNKRRHIRLRPNQLTEEKKNPLCLAKLAWNNDLFP